MNNLIIKIMGIAFPQTFLLRNDISTALGTNVDFVPLSIIFSLLQWKYNFFKKKFVEMPHLFYANTSILFVL